MPVTALLLIDDALAEGQIRASLELYTPSDPEQTTIAGRTVPLEVEPTASLAFGLSNPEIWATELRGLLFGDLLRTAPTNLAELQPHQPGRSPVVFVRGTASSVGRSADMVNDLLSDRAIHDRFEFWFFAYETGNPIPYSALQLRRALEQAVASLDPAGKDAALRDMVIIGHSQGGLLAKMTAIDTDLWDHISREPLEQLRWQPEARELLQESLFLEPEPFVGRVIFIGAAATVPRRGDREPSRYQYSWKVPIFLIRSRNPDRSAAHEEPRWSCPQPDGDPSRRGHRRSPGAVLASPHPHPAPAAPLRAAERQRDQPGPRPAAVDRGHQRAGPRADAAHPD